MSDPRHTFSVEDDGSVRIEMPSGVGVDVDARGTTTSRIIAASLRQLLADNAALIAERDAWRRRAEESEPHLTVQFQSPADGKTVPSYPGVQGLAQLGRNAIERVSELERGIAYRDQMIRQLSEELDDLIETIRSLFAYQAKRDETIRQLRAQLDEYERAPTFTYMYRFPHMGGFVWRHSSSDFNGARPVESIELIARPTRKGE